MPDYDFDPKRASLKTKDKFKPLYVKKTISLQEALDHGEIKADTELLLLNHPDEPIALIKATMTYHHVAQGKIAGEPWMVSF